MFAEANEETVALVAEGGKWPESILMLMLDAALAISEGIDLAEPLQPFLAIFQLEVDTQWREQCGFIILRDHPINEQFGTDVIETLISFIASLFETPEPEVRFGEGGCESAEAFACHLGGVLTFTERGQTIAIAVHEMAHYLLWYERTLFERSGADHHDVEWLMKFVEVLIVLDSVEHEGSQLVEAFDHENLCSLLEGLELFTLGAFARHDSCLR